MSKFLDRYALLLIWAFVALILIVVTRNLIVDGVGFGPDDQLRQVQLRDWFAGQGWFDTTQYRIAWPDSQPMHWPRWIELPLAFVILPLAPLVGTGAAETMAMVAVPLIALLIAMALVLKITEPLFGQRVALLAVALTATAVPLVAQLRPMRIDHHGWQVVLALFVLWTMFWPQARRGGLCFGLATALWLSISLEGLPLAVALAALLALRWLTGAADGQRLFWMLLGLTLGSAMLLAASQGAAAFVTVWCDAVSWPHLAAMAVATLILLPAAAMSQPALWLRFAALALAGAGALLALLLTAPQCAGGAMQLDPLVRELWYQNVREGLPLWQQPWRDAAAIFGGIIVTGLIALPFLWRGRLEHVDRRALFTIVYAFGASLVIALLVQRAAATAAAFALPLGAWLVERALVRARALERPVTRILATVAVMGLILPGPLALAAYDAVATNEEEDSAGATSSNSDIPPCEALASLDRLNALPRARIVAPFNLGPKILVRTEHAVLASSHHRNNAAMANQIALLTGDMEQAREILKARGIGYIAVCPDDSEMEVYARRYPEGLWAKLQDRQGPDWLDRVYLTRTRLMVWRVVS